MTGAEDVGKTATSLEARVPSLESCGRSEAARRAPVAEGS